MAVAVTNTSVTNTNTVATMTANAATSTVIDTTEVFTITPTKADKDGTLIIYNGNSHGTISCSVAAGAGVFADSAALTVTVAQNVFRAIKLDGKYKSSSGTFVITVTPNSGKRLLTDHAMGMYFIEDV